MKTISRIFLLSILFLSPAFAADTTAGATTTTGTPVMGRDSAGRARFVKIDENGAVVTSASGSGSTTVQPPLCGSPRQVNTVFGTTATLCPATRGAGSNWLLMCNEGSSTVKVRFDGQNPDFTPETPGFILLPGECYSDYFAVSIVPRCIADQSSAVIATLECVRP